jgi:hypothetical protein
MARASRRAHWRDARLDNVHLKSRNALAHCRTWHVPPLRTPRTHRGPRIECSSEHVSSRTGGRAVHGIVPPAFEFRSAQCRVGLPREWRHGEARRIHQEGRRDARRWPKPSEDDIRLTPPQGGEPEPRRDQRRTRRQAGVAEERTHGKPSAAPRLSPPERTSAHQTPTAWSDVRGTII